MLAIFSRFYHMRLDNLFVAVDNLFVAVDNLFVAIDVIILRM